MWRIWIREIVGAVLILAGLTTAGFCVSFLKDMYIIEGGMLVILTFILVGAGGHLLKVALAVDALMQEKRAK